MKNLFVIIALAVFATFVGYASSKFISKAPNKAEVPDQLDPKVTLDSIYTEILKLRLDHPTIVFSQVLLETGNLTSDLYKTNNNLFGMRVSGNRATTSIKIVNGYKWYKDWRESLIDYSLLQMAFYKDKSEEEYFNQLSRAYAQDASYIDKLKKIREKL